MPATETLATTTLAEAVDATTNLIKLASTSGLYPGTRLWFDGELVRVVSVAVDPWVNVVRGVDGTKGAAHPSAVTVYIGQAHQFYASDPVGRPDASIPVSPYINVIGNRIWFAQGDAVPGTTSDRWWQLQTNTRGFGALGVRTSTYEPTSST